MKPRRLATILSAAILSAASAFGTATVSADEKKPKPEPDRYLAVRGGIVHTVTGARLEGATVLAKNGKVLAIDRHVEIPEGATELDATGHHVYPGLIALSSSGVVGWSSVDGADVYSLNMTLGLAGGLTTVVVGNSAAKLARGAPQRLVISDDIFLSLNYSSRSPRSRRDVRRAFEQAREYLREKERVDAAKKRDDRDVKEPKAPSGEAAKALRLMRGEAAARTRANDVHEIRSMVELARQYGFRIVLDGAREIWSVASEVGRAQVAAVITPRSRVDADPRLNRPSGTSIETARILWDHGVSFGLVPPGTYISAGGLAGRDLLHLPMEAAHAVRGGLPERAAIEAITIMPARMLGLDHRVGSIEVGKDADLIVTDGPLLHYMTHVRWSVVDGHVAYDKAKDSLFDHIRAEKTGSEPARDHWPRRLGEDW